MMPRKNELFVKAPLVAAGFLSVTGAVFADGPAAADSLPVIAVNREVGLSVTGSYRGQASNSDSRFSYGYAGRSPSYTSDDYGRTRWSGWMPGFQADAQSMFDAGSIKHLYTAASFDLSDGDSGYHYSSTPSNEPYVLRDRRTLNRSGINVTGELGKGFLLAQDRFLITPVIQGGYFAGGVSSLTASGKGYVGLALHLDYAITDRLVIRGRAGWAQVLQATGADSSRPQWRGDVGLDYRLTRSLHLTGGVRYTYMKTMPVHGSPLYYYTVYRAGSGVGLDTDSQFHSSYRVRSWENDVQLRLGLAYQF